jgi:hypothetical protein
MEKLRLLWERNWYSDLLLSVALLIVFIVSIRKRKYFPQFRFLPYYFFSFILLQGIFYWYYLIPEESTFAKQSLLVRRYLDISVTFIEFLSFAYFFYSILIDPRKKIITKRISQIFYIASIFIVVNFIIPSGYDSYEATTVIYLLASFAILLPCYFYYRELIILEQKIELFKSANFWMAAGVTFYSLCTLPTTLVLNYFYIADFKLYQTIFSIINVFYIVLILLVGKSYFSKPYI